MTLDPHSLVHENPFDPTYGYELDDLLAVAGPPQPHGFEGFWQDSYKAAMNHELDYEITPTSLEDDRFDLRKIMYTGIDGMQVGAWLAIPKGDIIRGRICGHGYGGREALECKDLPEGFAVIAPVARGFHISANENLPLNEGHKHVLVGIDHIETYIHRKVVQDMWIAHSILLAELPQLEGQVDYEGGSFGGGMGAICVAWDKRIQSAHLHVPSHGNYPLRLTLPCVGSQNAVTTYYHSHPGVLRTLSYHDAAIHARYISVPTSFSCALFDPAVPPPGQFSVHNEVKASLRKLYVITAGHHAHPDEAQELNEAHAKGRVWRMEMLGVTV
jgi:cephalosporin-C deacetylase